MLVGYVYFSGSLIINGKIDSVDYIEMDDNSKKIVGKSSEGNSETIAFDGGSSYLILVEDTINLNIGDVIDTKGLVNCADYFLKGQDFWYQEQIKNANNKNDELQTNINNQNNLVNSLIEMVITTTLPTT